MSTADLLSQLEKLHALILQERECAKKFDMDGMQVATREKEAMLALLNGASDPSDEVQALIEKIRGDNRRNAYLFWSTLNWIRENIAFLGKKTAPAGYGYGGGMVQSGSSGVLLSGKV